MVAPEAERRPDMPDMPDLPDMKVRLTWSVHCAEQFSNATAKEQR